jgi:hypothetical protein
MSSLFSLPSVSCYYITAQPGALCAMAVPRSVQQEVMDLWVMADAASKTKTRKHESVMEPTDLDDTYRVATDYDAVHSCAPNQEVSDTAANAFAAWLTKGALPVKVALLYTHFYSTGTQEGSILTGYDVNVISDRFVRHIENAIPGGLLGLDMLIVPLHSAGHWRLGIIDFAHQRFELYDTLPLSSVDNCEEFANHMIKFLTAYGRARMPAAPMPNFDKFVRVINIGLEGEKSPQQKDGTSCGIFMLAIALFRSRGWRLSCLRGDDANTLRMGVTYTISTHKDVWASINAALAARVDMPPPPRRPTAPPVRPTHPAPIRSALKWTETPGRPPKYENVFGRQGAVDWDTDNPPVVAPKKIKAYTGNDLTSPISNYVSSSSAVPRSSRPSLPPPLPAARVVASTPISASSWMADILAAPPPRPLGN